MQRIRYNRASIDSCIEAGRRAAREGNLPTFVYATACGFVVRWKPAPFQDSYRIAQTGEVSVIRWPAGE